MTGSHNPAPGSLETGSQQPTPRRCAAETLAPPNHRDLRGYRCRGEAGFQTRGHCQSCFSSCSKLTRGRRGLQGGASSRTRESVGVGVGVGRAGAAPRWTVPAAEGAGCGDSRRNPGGECGAWNRRGRGGAWPERGRWPGLSPPLQSLRARARPSARLLASSPSSASSERGWFVGRLDSLVVYDSLNPHTFHSSPL